MTYIGVKRTVQCSRPQYLQRRTLKFPVWSQNFVFQPFVGGQLRSGIQGLGFLTFKIIYSAYFSGIFSICIDTFISHVSDDLSLVNQGCNVLCIVASFWW